MKQYEVLQLFTDKETGIVYNVGDLYPKLPSDERIKSLLKDGHPNHEGAIIGEIESKAKSSTIEGKPTEQNTVAEIKKYLTEKGIDFSNATKKDELLKLV